MTEAFALYPTCWDCGGTLDTVQVGPPRRDETTTMVRCGCCKVAYALNVRMAPFGKREAPK